MTRAPIDEGKSKADDGESMPRAIGDEASSLSEKKLAAIRVAAQLRFPAPNIDQMLAEIRRGYDDGSRD